MTLRPLSLSARFLCVRQHRRVAGLTLHPSLVGGSTSSACCHNDSKGKTVKLIGPAIDLLERDVRQIISEKLEEVKLEERSTLQKRIDLLQTLGCSQDHILENVAVLNLSESEVIRRANMLKKIGRQLTVNLLVSTRSKDLKALSEYFTGWDSLDQVFYSVFNCSKEDLVQFKERNPKLRKLTKLSSQTIHARLQLLLRYVSKEEVWASPTVLIRKLPHIQRHMQILHDLRSEGKLHFHQYPLDVAAMLPLWFETRVRLAANRKKELDGSDISMVEIADRLGTTEEDLERVCLNLNSRVDLALGKLECLLDAGVKPSELLNHIYVVKYNTKYLKEALLKAKQVTLGSPNLNTILSFLRSGQLPKRDFPKAKQRGFLAASLGVKECDLPDSSACLRDLYRTDRLVLSDNIEFLLSQGFSIQDLVSMPLVLSHDSKILKRYYSDFLERAELLEYSREELTRDKKRVLSLLQYVIEKDMNFYSAAFHADVEFDQEVAVPENLGANDSVNLETELHCETGAN